MNEWLGETLSQLQSFYLKSQDRVRETEGCIKIKTQRYLPAGPFMWHPNQIQVWASRVPHVCTNSDT